MSSALTSPHMQLFATTLGLVLQLVYSQNRAADEYIRAATTWTPITAIEQPEIPCDSIVARECVTLCKQYVKDQCSPTGAQTCAWATAEQNSRCATWCAPAITCIRGEIFFDDNQDKTEEKTYLVVSCEDMKEKTVKESIGPVDLENLRARLEAASCPLQQLDRLRNEVEEEIGRESGKDLKKCRDAAMGDPVEIRKCEKETYETMMNRTGKTECLDETACLGEKKKLLEEGAKVEIRGVLKECLNKTRDTASKATKEELRICMKLVLRDAEGFGLDETQTRKAFQKLAKDEGTRKLEVCLLSQDKLREVVAYKFDRQKMRNDQSALSVYVMCVGLAQTEYEKYGGSGRFEAAIVDQGKGVSTSFFRNCQSDLERCKTQAREAIRDSGIVDEKLYKVMQEGASDEALQILESCRRVGGSNCIEEAKDMFRHMGGDLIEFETSIASSRTKDLQNTMSSCMAVGADDFKCRDDAEKAYVLAGGDRNKFALDVEKAAGAIASLESRICFAELGDHVSDDALNRCKRRATDSCVGAGGSEKDCSMMQKQAARNNAADTLTACLIDATCTNVDGKRQCSNTQLERQCILATRTELKFGEGSRKTPTATDINNAKMRADAQQIATEKSSCVGQRLSAGGVTAIVNGATKACTAEDAALECKRIASELCDNQARALFESRGGDALDYERAKERAAHIAVKDITKSCMLEQLRSEILVIHLVTGERNCTISDRNKSSDGFRLCIDAARLACHALALETLVEQGGDVDLFEMQREKAANVELQDVTELCVILKTTEAVEITTLQKSLPCATMFDCQSESGKRLAASLLCKEEAKAEFALAGGAPDDLEFQALQQTRAGVSDVMQNCKRSTAIELTTTSAFTNLPMVLEGEFETVFSDASGILTVGQHEAACRKQAEQQMEVMGISKEDVALELRKAAANAAQEQMRGCLEVEGFTESRARAEVALFKLAREACIANISAVVLQAGGLVGNLKNDFKYGARSAMSNAIRSCMKAKDKDGYSEMEKDECQAKGEKTFLLAGGDPEKIEEERQKGAQNIGRDLIKSCLASSGGVTSVLKQTLFYGTPTDKQITVTKIRNCVATAGPEILAIGNESSLIETLSQMRQRSALEVLDATFDTKADDVASAIDRAILEIQVMGASDDDIAEEELAVALDCNEKSAEEMCMENTIQLEIAGSERCCATQSEFASIDMQIVVVGNKGVPGNGVINFIGTGKFRESQNELEKYCLAQQSGLFDAVCADIQQQSVNEVRTNGDSASVLSSSARRLARSPKIDAERTTLVAQTFRGKQEPTEIVTGRSRGGTSIGRGEYSGFLQVESAKFAGSSKISGEGRSSFSKIAIENDAEWEADVAVSDIDIKEGRTVEIRGRTIISKAPNAEGNIDGEVTKRSGQIKTNTRPSLVFDNSEDNLGDSVGANIRDLIPDDVKSQATKKSFKSRCSRYCRSDSSIKSRISSCRNFDPRTLNETLREKMIWAVETGHVDCLKPLKRCVKVCLMGANHEIKQTLRNLSIGVGGVTASSGLQLVVESLDIIGEKGFVGGTPKDDALDASGTLISDPSVIVLSLPGVKKLDIGCDLTQNINTSSQYVFRACVGVPEDAEINTLTVRVSSSRTDDEAIIGRRIAKFMNVDRSGRRLSSVSASYIVTSTTFSVEDESGNDISYGYKQCCFNDGIGVAPLSASDSECPSCAVAVSTTTKTTSTVPASTSMATSSLQKNVEGTTSMIVEDVIEFTTTSTISASASKATSSPQKNIEGTISMIVEDVHEFSRPEVIVGLRTGIASVVGVLVDAVSVTVRTASRRLRSSEKRKLAGVVHVDYVITLPPSSDPATYVSKVNEPIAEIAKSITPALAAVGVTQIVSITSVTAVVTLSALSTSAVPTTTPNETSLPRSELIEMILVIIAACACLSYCSAVAITGRACPCRAASSAKQVDTPIARPAWNTNKESNSEQQLKKDLTPVVTLKKDLTPVVNLNSENPTRCKNVKEDISSTVSTEISLPGVIVEHYRVGCRYENKPRQW